MDVLDRLIFGTANFGLSVLEPEARNLIDCALSHGITAFDTANSYGPAEEYLGRALRGRQASISTKVGNPYPGQGAGLSAIVIEKQIARSLRRLQIDCVDLYFIHNLDAAMRTVEIVTAFDRLVKSGHILRAGACNVSAGQFYRFVLAGWRDVQIPYNVLETSMDIDAYPGPVAVQAYSPLAGGVLTGKYQTGILSQTRAADIGPVSEPRESGFIPKLSERNQNLVTELTALAGSAGLMLPAMCLRWLVAQPQIDRIVLGARTVAQLEQNLERIDEPLPSDVLAAIDALA